jgi:glycosyltransferase involved in cell wall biosynthesis
LRSLERQEHPFVAVVVDDGSPKRREVRDIAASLDNRFRLLERVRQPSDLATASNALNAGFEFILETEKSVGALCYLHSDDMLPPESLRNRFESLSQLNPMVYGRSVLIDEKSRVVGYYGSGKAPSKSAYYFSHHTSLWERDFLLDLRDYMHKKYGQESIFDGRITNGEDWDVTLSSLELLNDEQKTSYFVHTPSYYYRIHQLNITGETLGSERSKDIGFINEKHHISWKDRTFPRLAADLPWSMGTFLPEPAKRLIRPVRNGVKRMIFGDIKSMLLSDPLLSS